MAKRRRRRKSIIPGFSWRRAFGITKAKQRIARMTGIPTTKQGRRNKLRRLTGCGGCLVEVLSVVLLIVVLLILLF